MRFAATALALLAVSVSTSAFAGDPKPATQEVEKKKEAKEEKKICKRISDMGSRRTVRKCFTRKQWLEFNRGN